jgi:putative acetyltransferase
MKKHNFSPIILRKEIPDDIPGIHELNIEAFDGPGEAHVVDLLRESCDPFISIVAEINGQVVGHILFTPVRLVPDEGEVLQGMGLAPLAVRPEFQNQGIGSILCKAGLEEMQTSGTPFVVVLGHPQYYPRFGFEPAANFNLRCSYAGVPEEAFMVRVFQPQKLEGLSGVMYYQQEFDAVS